jgi:hypothetical protein
MHFIESVSCFKLFELNLRLEMKAMLPHYLRVVSFLLTEINLRDQIVLFINQGTKTNLEK